MSHKILKAGEFDGLLKTQAKSMNEPFPRGSNEPRIPIEEPWIKTTETLPFEGIVMEGLWKQVSVHGYFRCDFIAHNGRAQLINASPPTLNYPDYWRRQQGVPR